MTRAQGLVVGEDGTARCWWGASTPDYARYHDEEWGYPVHDDRRLFEKICLEGFQSGLSWLTILRKRDEFRRSFADFDFEVVARFGARDVKRLLGNAGIVRHRGKIESTINNAQRAIELVREYGSVADYFWEHEPPAVVRPKRVTRRWLSNHPTSAESVALSADLKRRGWSFVGPTTVYAFMQAMGMVNDHIEGCGVRATAERARVKPVRRP